MSSVRVFSIVACFLVVLLQNSFCIEFSDFEFDDSDYFDFANDTGNDSIVFSSSANSGRNIRKCCLLNEFVVMNANGSLHCASLDKKDQNQPSQWMDNQISGFGIPNCSYVVVANDKHRWFRYTSEIEVSIQYLLYPVWSRTKGDYCIDEYYPESDSLKKNQRNVHIHEFSFANITKSKISKEMLAFCDFERLDDFYFKSGLTLFLVLTSVVFNCATVTLYIIARKSHSSRDWLHFFIFLTELMGNASFCTIIISQTYFLLWEDHIPFVTWWFCIGYYMYTTKFSLVIATSIDLLLCVWRPFSAVDERTRAKRNHIAIIVCCLLPLLIPGITYLWECLEQKESSHSVVDANRRMHDGAPKYYGKVSNIVFLAEMAINIIFAIITTMLIKRQEVRKRKIKDESGALKNINQSFVLYIRLIFSTELPFTINFVLLIWLSAYSPLNLWWNLTRVTYLVSALYTFTYFGCNRKNKKHLKRLIYNHTSISSSFK